MVSPARALQFVRSWAQFSAGDAVAGNGEFVTAFDDWKRSEVQLWTPGFGNLVAQAQLSEGNIDAAMDVVTDELARIEETGLRQFSSLLLKTQGDIHCAAGRLEDAGRCYQSAIDMALSQSRQAMGTWRSHEPRTLVAGPRPER